MQKTINLITTLMIFLIIGCVNYNDASHNGANRAKDDNNPINQNRNSHVDMDTVSFSQIQSIRKRLNEKRNVLFENSKILREDSLIVYYLLDKYSLFQSMGDVEDCSVDLPKKFINAKIQDYNNNLYRLENTSIQFLREVDSCEQIRYQHSRYLLTLLYNEELFYNSL